MSGLVSRLCDASGGAALVMCTVVEVLAARGAVMPLPMFLDSASVAGALRSAAEKSGGGPAGLLLLSCC